jgi:hypothetical protein
MQLAGHARWSGRLHIDMADQSFDAPKRLSAPGKHVSGGGHVYGVPTRNEFFVAFIDGPSKAMVSGPNKADAPNPAIGLRFQVERQWRRVGDPGRSMNRINIAVFVIASAIFGVPFWFLIGSASYPSRWMTDGVSMWVAEVETNTVPRLTISGLAACIGGAFGVFLWRKLRRSSSQRLEATPGERLGSS